MEQGNNFENKKSGDPTNEGQIFNDPPLSFEEFNARNKDNCASWNNFFFNFNKELTFGLPKNYIRLEKINKELADEISDLYHKNKEYFYRNSNFPKEVLEKGYQAYLILRDKLKEDKETIEQIERYNEGRKVRSSDDWAAFFS